MTIDDEIFIRAVLILADSGFHKRRIFQSRETEPKVVANHLQSFWGDGPLAGSRVELWAASVVGDLESAPLISGNAIEKVIAVVSPDREVFLREAVVASWRAKEEDILLGRADVIAYGLRKQSSQPGPASKYILIRS